MRKPLYVGLLMTVLLSASPVDLAGNTYTAEACGGGLCGGIDIYQYLCNIYSQYNIPTPSIWHCKPPPTPPSPSLTVSKSGPSSVTPGTTATYTVTIQNPNSATVTDVVARETIPDGFTFLNGQSTPSCYKSGSEIVCPGMSIPAGGSKTLTISFSVPSNANCNKLVQDKVTVTGKLTKKKQGPCGCQTTTSTVRGESNTVQTQILCISSSSSSSSSVPTLGCVTVTKEAYDTFGNPLSPVPQFTIRMDGSQTAFNDGSGRVQFNNLSPGYHTVSEDVPATWQQLSITPANGTVYVAGGPQCSAVIIKNRQFISSSSSSSSYSSSSISSSSSSSSSVYYGCIDVVKETYDTKGNPFTPVPQFTFMMDGASQTVNDGTGLARFVNVPLGTHTVTESLPATWNQLSVTPTGGTVLVDHVVYSPSGMKAYSAIGSNQCARVVFKNQQVLSSSSSSTPSARLTIQKSGPSTVLQGNSVTYTVTVSNSGPSDAQNVVVNDAVPSGLTFNQGGSSNSCSLQGSTVQCNVGTLGANQTSTLTLAFTSQTPVTNQCVPMTVNNTATVSTSTQLAAGSQTQSTATTNMTCPASSSSSSSTIYGCLEVIKEAYDTNGNTMTPVPQFTMTLDGTTPSYTDNTGHALYVNVPIGYHTVTENVPATWQQLSVTPANGSVFVPGGNQCGVVVFKNKQFIGSSSSSSSIVSSSSSSSSSTPSALLTIQKSGPSTVLQGNSITYTVTVSNSGPSDAQSVVVNDAVPSGLTFNPSGSSNNCSLRGSTVQCNVGTLGANQTTTLTLAFLTQTPVTNQCVPMTVNNTATLATTTTPAAGSVAQSTATTSMTCPASSSSSSSSSSSVYSSSSSSVQTFYGCVKVVKEAFDVSGNPMTPVPQFTFRLDGDQVAWNDDTGQALFRSIPLGFHTVTEDVPPGWKNLFITPQYGNVFVGNSDHCSIVNFKNKQLNPALLNY